jgi:hypothetical protein
MQYCPRVFKLPIARSNSRYSTYSTYPYCTYVQWPHCSPRVNRREARKVDVIASYLARKGNVFALETSQCLHVRT